MSTTDEVKVGPSRLTRVPKISITFDARQFNRAMKRAVKQLNRFAAAFTADEGQRTERLSQMHTAYRARSRRRTRSRR